MAAKRRLTNSFLDNTRLGSKAGWIRGTPLRVLDESTTLSGEGLCARAER